ncbi:polysaccharide pyruvyl transferase family protein [Croceitalea rosinachiae]|uniref:Polysaccharide pyruvyl transferase family protein n=1 Tax=Croceitalea rosinachiae TaxID=3075596 RepID=A0ABU3A7V7_9FLAO|nr:polysaccharide pyruvyl transferase family protein [Croceitalea sp. F388]MDT0606246.1 polysaccharide pyruvyl transferase family protein [Croceitalea sp. F388]
MKIGLITIHNVTNYGAILQAYATIQALSKYGDVTVINYQKNHLSHHMDLFRFKKSIRGIKMLGHDVLNFSSRSKMLSKFNKFIKQNMVLSEKVKREELLNKIDMGFDLYICGSDQIWNPEIVSSKNILDPIFFLSFAPKGSKKISYASSIGHHQFTNSEKPKVKEWLEDFNKISIREADGRQKLLEILPDKKVQQVLDPTLLFSKEEWLQKLNIPVKQPKEKYILVYSVPRTELIRKAILFFSKKLNYKVYSIDKGLIPMQKVDNQINKAGPKDYIELFANASFVITDSFHGLCFSINFEKPFAAISSKKVGNRQENLLELMKIDDRLMRNEKDFYKLNTNLENVEGQRNILRGLRENSLNYLESSIIS